MASTQVAVRIETELLEGLDWLIVRCSFENRAEGIRAALAAMVKQEREREIDEQIAAAYRHDPSAVGESVAPHLSSWDGLDDGDWSGWD
jgi:metal-responsive CopG/Arc/MetJ family transcriptional regulator